jgi:DNA-binding Xre family transcriptional regulator
MGDLVKLELAVLRAKHGRITQSELARLTGITQKQLSALERGVTCRIDFGTIWKLCTFFRCTPNDLLTLSPPVTDEETAAADRLIDIGLQRAMQAPPMSADAVWAKFDAARTAIAASAET